MRRLSVLLSVLAVALVALFAAGRASGTTAQDATPGALAGHPLVGSWVLDTNADDPANPPSLARFSADGGYVEVDVDGVAVGSWEATGERTATLTFAFLEAGDGQFFGTGTVRATIEVDAGGDGLTAQYTLEFVGPDGTGGGGYGPCTATAARMAVEPPGTPVGTLQDLFAQFEGGTPEAGTPAA